MYPFISKERDLRAEEEGARGEEEEDHPDTLTSMNNLASSYSNGQRKEAWGLREKSLEAREKMLGEEHPDTLMLMSNLAIISSGQNSKSRSNLNSWMRRLY
jgi:hypothetical protein